MDKETKEENEKKGKKRKQRFGAGDEGLHVQYYWISFVYSNIIIGLFSCMIRKKEFNSDQLLRHSHCGFWWSIALL